MSGRRGPRRASSPAYDTSAHAAATPAADGAVDPEGTRDDTDAGWGETSDGPGSDARERWLRAQRPPHWE